MKPTIESRPNRNPMLGFGCANAIVPRDQTGSFDLGGITLKFGPADHQEIEDVFLTVVKDGHAVPLN